MFSVSCGDVFCAYGLQVVYYEFVGSVRGGKNGRKIESFFKVFSVVSPVSFDIVGDGFSVCVF